MDAADRFLGSAVAPSKQLLAFAAREIQDREQFVLLDEHQVVSPGFSASTSADPSGGRTSRRSRSTSSTRRRRWKDGLGAMLASGIGARMTAGYCWRWSDPRSDGTLVHDVVVDGWSRPWNLKSARSVGGAPASSLWASDPAGVRVPVERRHPRTRPRVAVGVLAARRELNKDPDLRSRTSVDDATFDRLVRNVYKVLLTRGLVGTLLYSVDAETQAMLRGVVNPQ